MNQILVTEKLYITPELKKKKKMYKIYFIISIFLVCVLTSFYIYAEYDRNKGYETSQKLLTEISETLATTETDNTIADKDVLVVLLDESQENYTSTSQAEVPSVSEINEQAETKTTASGYKYKIIATVQIPKINVDLTVVQGETGELKETEELLKISPVKFHGYDPNEVGNFCIVGHNYRNTKFFSKVPTLKIGDTVKLTDLTKRTLTYSVYDIHTVIPDDTSDTTQLTGGKKEITLITCTDDSSQRVIVKCKEVK